MCILIPKNFNGDVKNVKIDVDGRTIMLEICIYTEEILVVNVYAPNEDNPEFFVQLFESIESYQNPNKIVGGDFNLVLNTKIDKKGGLDRTHEKSRTLLNTYIEEMELVDIWRQSHQDERKYTWYRLNPAPIFCRLDFFLVSAGLVGNVENCDIKPGFRTDHSAIIIELVLNKTIRGKGFWKLNSQHLKDSDYVNMLNNIIDSSYDKYNDLNPSQKWEMIKLEITGESIKYSLRKAKSKNKILEVLQRKLDRLNNNLESEDDEYKIKRLKKDIDLTIKEIEEKIESKTKGNIFRSKSKWYIQGEHNSKYFLSLEKHNSKKKTMKCTIKDDGSITRDQDEILKEQAKFYKKLYTADENVEFNYTNEENIMLNELEKMTTDVDITLKEISSAVKSMPNGKSPGCDGLPVEFYKMFWTKIKNHVYENIIYCLDNNKMNISARRGIITLLPKKGKDINYLKNWRPLTLLNIDYKIVAKVIANRIKPYLHRLINVDQSGFMSNRFIGENIRNALDIMQYTEEQNIAAVLIAVDFEKCFDRIEWKAIDGALNYFNFWERFRNMVKTLYTDIQSCTVNEGWSSEWFSPTRGLRQGCPASPYLFLIVAEILAQKIRNNPEIKGIKIKGQEKKLSQFADDTVLFSLYEDKSLNGIIDTVSQFEQGTGLKVNYDKTLIYRIGSLKNSDTRLYTVKEFKWTSDDIDVLGTTLTHDVNQQLQCNFEKIMSKAKLTLDSWGNRTLSLMGKKVIVNTLVGSLFPYNMSVLRNFTKEMYKEFEKLIREFIWNGKRDKISINRLKNQKSWWY